MHASQFAPAASGGMLGFRVARLQGKTTNPSLPLPRSLFLNMVLCFALLPTLFIHKPEMPCVIFPTDDLPAHWSVQAGIQPATNLIDIHIRTNQGNSRIMLTQPNEQEPLTWFSLNDGIDSVKYIGARQADGRIIFTRAKRKRLDL
jgi:hypothetical protein